MVIPLGVYAVVILLTLFILFYRIEKIKHEKSLKSIPIRIWVNGTRGKSSVTRLIAAGLRAGGKKIIAKTTGTSPRFIIDNNSEKQVVRLGMANIKEQIRIIQEAAKANPNAIVVECMALRPDLQSTESMIVEPTAMVITNVRADHLDIMGPTIKDIAKAFINATPKNCPIFTAEFHIFKELTEEIHKKKLRITTSNASKISENIIKKFSYIEHKENVALAIDVCEYFGVNEKTSLKGMQNINPDPGALRKYEISCGGKEITLIYAMAANDPESTYLIWQSINKNYPEVNVLVNCRDDRIDRSFQLAELIINNLKAEHYILTGSGTEVLMKKICKTISQDRILNLGGKSPEDAVNEISRFVINKSLVFAIGNTVGYGEKLTKQFLINQQETSC